MLGSLLTGTALSTVRDRHDALLTDVGSVERVLWAVVLASVALDVYTTALGLGMGLSEGNPAMRWAIHDAGIAALAAAKALVVAGAAAVRAARPKYGLAIALGLALPWSATVLVNTVTLATI